VSLRGRSHTAVQSVKLVEFLMVACGHTHFAIQAEVVRSVIRPDEGDVEALLSAVGITSSPMHLSEQFGLTGSYLSPDSRILVCGMQGRHFAFRVDRVLGLHDIDAAKIKPLLPHFIGPERRWIAGMFLFQKTVALALHTRWLLSDDRASRAVLSPVLESAPREQNFESFQQPVMDITAVERDDREWTNMEFEEVTDADDTPWAQI